MAAGDIIAGGCGCGAVRYTATDGGFLPYACHCTGCQTRQGSSFALNQQVPAAGLVVDGDTISGTVLSVSGARVTHHACPLCLTRLYTVSDRRPALPTIRTGTRDDSAGVVPAFHIWTRHKQPWIVLPPGVPAFSAEPDDAAWERLVRGEGSGGGAR
ncbi:GFA family protein [Novosphingobium sp. KCTC 2891]|uniref:GFA family protein n=1 Tax=Novosphingobium sp. KCTC 2891 TaxID=2989730 RepID=UPI00222311A4|nr:GFA family protein [Novosphingobium sp. KCTC 2891]MCW1382005.1 GFA family protein [Novosphingobium sp. KCTC 2891]